jgi:SLIT-ROBO Rho GTPase activating protein
MLNSKDFYCSGYFGDGAIPVQKPPETVSIKLRADRQETEEFYLTVSLRQLSDYVPTVKPGLQSLCISYLMCHVQKFREYVLGTSRIARLDAKHEHIRQTLLDAAGDSPTSLKSLQQRHTGQTMKPPRRKRIGRFQMNGQPKLFGGSLEEYLETTSQEIPLIMKSCIRVINLYGGF